MTPAIAEIHTEQNMSNEPVQTLANRTAGQLAEAPAPLNPMELIRFALESKVDPAALKELVSLQHMIEDRNAAKEFAAAKARFKAACPPIAKNRKAEIVSRDGGNKRTLEYADLPEIVRVVDPLLQAEGLDYSWDSEDAGGKLKIICILKHVAGHREQSTWTTTTETNAAMSAQQKVAAAFTFGRRQTLVAILGLTTVDADNDGADVAAMRNITPKQAEDIESLIAELGVDAAKFLKTFAVSKVSDIRAIQFPTALSMLEGRRKAKGGAA